MPLTIALDGMGGDHAPDIVVGGAAQAWASDPDLRFLLVGDEQRIEPLVTHHRGLAAAVEVRHTREFVANDAKPSVALRQGRGTSMRLAINAVKEGVATAAVSAGNTGALMAMAKFVLKTLPGIDRPAICGVWPTRQRPVVTLDLGANVDCAPEHLMQFAVMGSVFARTLLGIPRPSLGLLNVGTEELKGDDVVRTAASLLRELDLPIEFKGFVEGTDVVSGTVDVVVTDGFTGNVALKIAEGTARMMMDEFRSAFASHWRGKLGYVVARSALSPLRTRFDPRSHNGAMFLGLSGVVVKSHGGTDALGFANAIRVAAKLVRERTNERIIDEMTSAAATSSDPLPQAAVS
jgi:glycerol-3-phosphate acyltransferase PlsX